MKNETLRLGDGSLLPSTPTVKQKIRRVSHVGHVVCETTPDGRVAVVVPPGAPAFLPPAGQPVTFEMLLPAPEPVNAFSTAPVPVTLELARPALPDGGSGLSWQRNFEAEPGDTFEDLVLATLHPDDPFEIALDGRPFLSKEGKGWQGRQRVTLTIRATSTPAMLALMGVVSPVNPGKGQPVFYVPICAGQLPELLIDGEPARRRQ